jgi:microsomal dipeptidase-like Zn-dependent dipeptidase
VDKFQCYRQCFAVFIRDDCRAPFDFYRAVLKDIKEKLKIKPISFIPYFTLEGASLIDSKEKVYELYLDDIRAITLTWNGENKIAGGVNSDKGLTPFGREIIGIINSLKIFTDLSHLNKKSFYGAIECAEFPFASHSNCFSIKQNKRNLSDEQIRLIAEKGGIIGHIKASAEVKNVEMFSVTDVDVMIKTAPEQEINIILAAIVFFVSEEEAEELGRKAFKKIKKAGNMKNYLRAVGELG